ncbi:MAG TPA: hypothetical protein VG186_10740 [Solirubrobacteraceae bacterium]|jgi:hypothetical protein|nr:hypothetical protein [Solirubrobacteraceae bacterium]
MTSRFISNLLVLVIAATLVSFSLVFRPGVLGWLGLGLGCLVVAVVLAAFVARGRGIAQRAIDVLVVLAGGWLIVASRFLGGAALKWVCFGTGALLAVLALVGLVVHEVSMELAVRPLLHDRGDGRVRTGRRERAPAR